MPVVPASQAEVNAGVVARKYVAPSTLAGWTGLSATNFARLNGTNIFTGTNTFHARLLLTNVAGAGTNLVLGPMVIAQTNGLVFFLSDYNGLTGPAWSITASGDAYFDNVGAGGVYSGDGSGLTNVPGAASTNANEYFDPQVWDAAKQQTNLFLLRSNVLVIPGIWQGATEPIGTGGAYLLFHTNAWLNGFYSDGVFVDVYAALSNTLNSPIFRFGDGGGTINASKVPLSVEGYLTVGGGFDALDYLILKPGGGAPWGLAMTNTAADGTTFTEQGVLVLSLTPTNVTVHTNLTVTGTISGNLSAGSLASGTNTATVQFATAKATNIWDPSNVKWWNAIGDGSTDDTVAFSNCFAWAAANVRSVVIPAAQSNLYYKITSPLTVFHQAQIVGEKDYRTYIRFEPAGDNVSCFSVADGADNWSIANLRIGVAVPATTNVNCIGVLGSVNSRATISSVDFINATGAGLSVTGAMYYTISGCFFNDNAVALDFRSFVGKCTVKDCRSSADSKFVFAEGASALTIQGCAIEAGGIVGGAMCEFEDGNTISLLGNFAEANLGTFCSFTNTTSALLEGNLIAGDSGGNLFTDRFVAVHGGSAMVIGNTLQNPSNLLFTATNTILVADRNDYRFNFTNVTGCAALQALVAVAGSVDFSQCRPIYSTSA